MFQRLKNAEQNSGENLIAFKTVHVSVVLGCCAVQSKDRDPRHPVSQR